MHFDILTTGRGVATTLRPRVFTESMHFAFDNSPAEQATAVFSDGEKAIYRELIDGECEIPAEAFDGDLHVAILAGGHRIACDDVNVTRVGDSVVVAPNLASLLKHVINQDMEISQLKGELSAALDRIEELDRKVRSYYEGFDLI
jgi:hypothetical protein